MLQIGKDRRVVSTVHLYVEAYGFTLKCTQSAWLLEHTVLPQGGLSLAVLSKQASIRSHSLRRESTYEPSYLKCVVYIGCPGHSEAPSGSHFEGQQCPCRRGWTAIRNVQFRSSAGFR